MDLQAKGDANYVTLTILEFDTQENENIVDLSPSWKIF